MLGLAVIRSCIPWWGWGEEGKMEEGGTWRMEGQGSRGGNRDQRETEEKRWTEAMRAPEKQAEQHLNTRLWLSKG